MKKIIPALLLLLGLGQMAADIFGLTSLKAILVATAVSPAPKVFSVTNGFETYSTKFFVEWTDRSGEYHSLELTPELNSRFRGPYNRRNIYGAAISYGPVLAVSPHTKKMLDQIMMYSLCGNAPILKEFGINPVEISGKVAIRFEPKVNFNNLPLVLEAPCK